jgi:hypothetical protein
MTNEQTTKTCADCGETRPLIHFSRRLSCKGGYNTTCKLCNRQGGIAYERRAAKRAERIAAGEPLPERSPKHAGAAICSSCLVVLNNGQDKTARESKAHAGLCEWCAGKG